MFAERKPNAGSEEFWFKVALASIAALAGILRPSVESLALDAPVSALGANLAIPSVYEQSLSSGKCLEASRFSFWALSGYGHPQG